MSRRFVCAAYCAAVLCMLIPGFVSAATMNYGDFVGNTVVYNDVTEANSEPMLLFSAPTVVGDTLEFNPVNFFAEVDPGPGSDITDSEIFTVIEAREPFFIDKIHITEEGDFTLIGIPGAFAETGVGAAFFFEVLEVNGVLVGDGPIGFASMQFTTGGGPNGGSFSLPGDAGTATPWIGTAVLDIDAAMDADPRFRGRNATSVRLSFDNALAAAAGANASAFIKKKEIGGIIIRTIIPEPSTIAIVLLALGATGTVAMRRRLG